MLTTTRIPKEMALALENLPSDTRDKPRYTDGNCSETLYSVVQRMEAEHIISVIVAEVFEDLSERRG